MIYEIVYGKEGTSDFQELATPKEFKGNVKKVFPMLQELRYPSESEVAPKPVMFCYTKGLKCKAILSCIKWFERRGGNYFAQHLVFENENDLIAAGPAWLIKRRGFYIDIEKLNDWSESEKDKKKIKEYDWKPIIQQSDYCIGLESEIEPHIESIIKDIAGTWNNTNEQKAKTKFVLLFDPSRQDDAYRLDMLYELYSRINKNKRWDYRFCTFDGQRGRQPPPAWDIVFVAESDTKTREYYKREKYESINLKGNDL